MVAVVAKVVVMEEEKQGCLARDEIKHREGGEGAELVRDNVHEAAGKQEWARQKAMATTPGKRKKEEARRGK